MITYEQDDQLSILNSAFFSLSSSHILRKCPIFWLLSQKVWLLPNVYEGKAFYYIQNFSLSNATLIRERHQKVTGFADLGDYDGSCHEENKAAVYSERQEGGMA